MTANNPYGSCPKKQRTDRTCRAPGGLHELTSEVALLEEACAQLQLVQQQAVAQAAELAELMEETATCRATNDALQARLDRQGAA